MRALLSRQPLSRYRRIFALVLGCVSWAQAGAAEAAMVTDAPRAADRPVDIVFEAARGESNDLQIAERNDQYVFVDRGARLHASGDCLRIRGHVVQCPARRYTSAKIRLEDGRDRFSVRGTLDISANINAGSGNDTLDLAGAPEIDTYLFGGAGNDRIATPDEDTYAWGGRGDDRLEGGAYPDTLTGGAGDDRVTGGRANDRLHGSVGQDRLLGGRGSDAANGGSGDDYLDGGAGPDSGGHRQLRAGSGRDLVLGGRGDDELEGEAGADVLRGGADADILEGEAGQDRAIGGAGDDTLESDSAEMLRCGRGADLAQAPAPGAPRLESCEQTEVWLRGGSYWLAMTSEPTVDNDRAVFAVDCQDRTRPCRLRIELSDPTKPNAPPFATAQAEFTPQDFDNGPAELAVALGPDRAEKLRSGAVVQVTITDRDAGTRGSYRIAPGNKPSR